MKKFLSGCVIADRAQGLRCAVEHELHTGWPGFVRSASHELRAQQLEACFLLVGVGQRDRFGVLVERR